jgi:Protein of unknown function (DUF2442)
MNSHLKSLPFNGLHWVIEDAEYLEGYKVKLWFRDGSVKVVDLEPELYGEMFEPLKDIALFAQVRYDEEASNIVFPNNADFAPEFLYEIGQPVTASAL